MCALIFEISQTKGKFAKVEVRYLEGKLKKKYIVKLCIICGRFGQVSTKLETIVIILIRIYWQIYFNT